YQDSHRRYEQHLSSLPVDQQRNCVYICSYRLIYYFVFLGNLYLTVMLVFRVLCNFIYPWIIVAAVLALSIQGSLFSFTSPSFSLVFMFWFFFALMIVDWIIWFVYGLKYVIPFHYYLYHVLPGAERPVLRRWITSAIEANKHNDTNSQYQIQSPSANFIRSVDSNVEDHNVAYNNTRYDTQGDHHSLQLQQMAQDPCHSLCQEISKYYHEMDITPYRNQVVLEFFGFDLAMLVLSYLPQPSYVKLLYD
ncbi:hypothetical protein RFI_27036, partial [Reticulomyxa filosa]